MDGDVNGDRDSASYPGAVLDKDTTPPINVTVIEFGCVTDDIQLSGADELCYPKTETLTSSFYMRCVCSSNKCNNPSNILIYDKVSAGE